MTGGRFYIVFFLPSQSHCAGGISYFFVLLRYEDRASREERVCEEKIILGMWVQVEIPAYVFLYGRVCV